MDDKSVEKKEESKYRLLGVEPCEEVHESICRSGRLNYLSRAGVLPLKDHKGETEAEIFFTAYELKGVENRSARPVTFVFNGGPGSSSIWLHMGAIGPRRVVMEPEGWLPSPPYRLEDNADTWLDVSDLVFIDPVETGYSRAVSDKVIDRYWGYTGDLDSVGEFIRLYLSRYDRWDSPVYLAGESYGTTRAAGLAGHLQEKHGIAPAGIVLISTAMSLRPIFFAGGDDLPFPLFLPTYALAARYHGQLKDELQQLSIEQLYRQVADWAESDLTVALMKGDRLSPEQREKIAGTLAEYTGLDPVYIERTGLRINIHRFCKELLRERERTVGRLDARFLGIEGDLVDDMPENDPSMSAIMYPYSAVMGNYLSKELSVRTDMKYRVMHRFSERKWKWENGELPDTGEILRRSMYRNPWMKVLVAQGYYDLATPSFATEYMVSHMHLDPEIRGNLSMKYYEAGHMFYLDVDALKDFRKDVSGFFKGEGPSR